MDKYISYVIRMALFVLQKIWYYGKLNRMLYILVMVSPIPLCGINTSTNLTPRQIVFGKVYSKPISQLLTTVLQTL